MSRMTNAITQLGDLVNEWVDNNHVPEVDWARIRSIDFQELLNKRNTCLKRIEGLGCVLCEEFEPHVRPATLFDFIWVISIYI
jgi:antiviral helicase SKI2